MRGRPPILTSQQIGEIQLRYVAGESTSDIAQDMEVTPQAVIKYLDKAGIPRRKGEGIKARLKTLAERPSLKNQMIYRMSERGTSIEKISQIFEISKRQVIARIQRYKKRFAVHDL